MKKQKKISIGYVTGHNFGGWCIPQKIQTAIIHFMANNEKQVISYSVSEYLDSKNNSLLNSRIKEDKNIKNIFFVSALQLNINNNFFYKTLNKFNLYFFLENLQIKRGQDLKKLKVYINQISKRKILTFKKNNYLEIYNEFLKKFS